MGLILGSGRSPGGGIGNPLQYSSLEKGAMDKGAWWATVYGVAKSQIQLSTHTHTHTHTHILIFHMLEHLEEKTKATKEAKEGS